MLPAPALAFTIPSIHDNTTLLDCRIHHPPALLAPASHAPSWRKRAAIVAHPYATLGGSHDDAVVETIAAALLRQGFVVGTFNFRGAGHSTGRTSWTGRAECGDYASFVGFVAYYVHYLAPPHHSVPSAASTSTELPGDDNDNNNNSSSSSNSDDDGDDGSAPVLLLCGYSYGAMVTQHLDPLAALLAPFATPPTASAAADIRLRAQHLAEKQNTILAASARLAASKSRREGGLASPPPLGGLRVGGDEDLRRSQEHTSRRSFSLDAEEKIRRGVAELMRAAKVSHHHHQPRRGDKKDSKVGHQHTQGGGADAQRTEAKEAETLPAVNGLVIPRAAYLLVSPPVGWATNLMTMNIGGFFGRRPKVSKTVHDPDAMGSGVMAERQKLLDNATLAIYGDADVFVAAKRFREWASKMQAEPGSRFRAHEISTAGHFYVEEGTLQRLADAVSVFSGDLVTAGRATSDS